MNTYRAKQQVAAIQWREDNLDEMIKLLTNVVEHDIDNVPCVYAEEIEPYFISVLGYRPGYKILKFYATSDDMEVDPGRWVVVYEDDEVEIMNDEEFNRRFEKS